IELRVGCLADTVHERFGRLLVHRDHLRQRRRSLGHLAELDPAVQRLLTRLLLRHEHPRELSRGLTLGVRLQVCLRSRVRLEHPHRGRELFLQLGQELLQLEKELPTTMRVLKAYPAAKADLKPHAKCKSARELAWMFVTEQKASEKALDGGIEFGKMPKAPATLTEVVAVYEQSSKAFVDRNRKTPDTELNKTVKFFVAPKQMNFTVL